MNDLYSVRMRASSGDVHISGAERIVPEKEVDAVISELASRAVTHERGRPDSITFSVDPINPEKIVRLSALPIATIEVANLNAGRELAMKELVRAGVSETAARIALKAITEGGAAPGVNMRGAMIIDAGSGERLEPDRRRGVRARHVDYDEDFLPELSAVLRERGLDKTHLKEALVLATKVANAPFAVAELCISDDPGYVTGYVASQKHGYVRITKLKAAGDPMGGRAFFVDGSQFRIEQYLEYMRETPVLVGGPEVINVGARFIAPAMGAINCAPTLEDLKQKSLNRKLHTVASRDGVKAVIEGKQYTLFCSNDYLGLTSNPSVKAAAVAAINDAGSGSGSAPLITGHSKYHRQFQEDIARFKGTEAALLFGSGFLANIGLIQSLMDRGGVIFSDELNHASIIDGCRLSRAEVRVYRHCDMNDLEKALKAAPAGAHKLIVTEGVFSMDGDIAPLPEIIGLSKQYRARVLLDEAHATGTIGSTGRGTIEHLRLPPEGVIQMGTLGKALGSYGAFAAADRETIEWLVNYARSFIFSTALPPSACAAASASLKAIAEEADRLRALRGNSVMLRSLLREMGYDVLGDGTPIIPVVVGPADETLKLASALMDAGFYAPAIRPPTVPEGKCRIRLTVSALHTAEDIEALADAFRRA